VREAVELKKEAFQVWLSQGSPEAVDRYQVAINAAINAAELVVAEAKTKVWEEFGKGLSVGLRDVLIVIRQLRKRKLGPS